MYKKNSNRPIIGICVSNDQPALQKLVKKRIDTFHGKATFIKFFLKDLNFKNLSVKGDYLENKKGKWKKGILPFPDVIYLQSHVALNVVNKIEKIIGRKVFNSFTLDKLQESKLLAKHNILQQHLPHTQKLNEMHLQNFLTKYENIVLKPIYGKTSIGLIRVELQESGKIIAFYREIKTMQKAEFKSYKDFWNWFSRNFFRNNYMMQQGIQTMKWNGMATDIRLNMNKNRNGRWEVSVLLFRIASNNSHLIPGPLAVVPLARLTNFNFKKEKIANMEMSIKTLGFKICNALDKSGHHMADLGIDLGFDEDGHLWIYEVNSLPHPILGVQDDFSLTRPLEYAHYLALKK
ncbi:YheC/YheD family protein [Halalkalibacter lacteus]|uniref:YheC/YheD family protein n=1 Tax=Halalkalibacter lacteus TaxID=3090663 RepID=UPI002FC6BA7C